MTAFIQFALLRKENMGRVLPIPAFLNSFLSVLYQVSFFYCASKLTEASVQCFVPSADS